ncbi:hypothetical protein [Sphingomonas sp. RIT328]|uniref:hypothetical protein n=1 Tax=Sphingomonas sp. RIT328 TaxID=1470591 RepID=UPI000450AE81|nr:hypothetical protein [Sphingomonas sp. RIT328]EZP57258.1 hypothetical protein BW41_00101 [Sphingomonas sp. RIT328]
MAAKTTAATKNNLATRFFKDAGTGKSFKAGEPVDVDDGTLANYEAAGLVGSASDAQQPTGDAPGADA